MRTLTAVLYRAPGTKLVVAQNPVTGTTTQGRMMDEAFVNLRETTELYLSEFPLPKTGRAVLTTFEVEMADAQASGVSGQRTVKALQRLGFVFLRQKGSHAVLRCGERGCVVPMYRTINPWTLAAVPKPAGVDADEFVAALK